MGMMEYVEVISPGLYSTIQDAGRIGFRKYGVPVSGVMDEQSTSLSNHLLNNPEKSAVMEITMMGPKLKFSSSALIAITGANISPAINGDSVPLNKALQVKKNDILSFGTLKVGTRCYLSVKNGFQTKVVMSSRSYYAPITENSMIKKGDKIPIESYEPKVDSFSAVKVNSTLFTLSKLRCDLGPEFELLSGEDKGSIFHKELVVTRDNNRMGYRLEGAQLKFPSDYNMLTSSVLPGTVQLTPSGNLIVLMKDCQTTGGYPRILQLTRSSLSILAQKKANDIVSFYNHR